LFESELFGYEKGSFTGAAGRKIGLLEYADGGTFFMDEVCELPVNLQTKMLRTLQDRQLRRVGGNELILVDLRLISATNQNLDEALEKETLRRDFYYRLNVINIQVPPLRERQEDIPLLAEHFLSKYLKTTAKEIKGFTDEVLRVFCSYKWPGNVRELENTVERAVTLCRGEKITLIDLPPQILNSSERAINYEGKSLTSLKQKAVEEIEKRYLLNLMEKYHGNITRVAEEAGLTRRHIHRMIKVYNIDPSLWRGK
jgi:transcriptional regulator with PAS, ATPase and Fis domain